jgi:hypothetical protein
MLWCVWERGDEHMTPTDTTIDYKVRSFLYLHSDFGYNSLGSICTCRYLNVGTNMSQSASSSKLNFRFVGSPAVLHCEGQTHPSGVWLRSMHTWWKYYLISFQIDIVPPQYHIGKSSKSWRYSIIVLAGSYNVIVGLLFTLRTQAQVGARPKKMEKHLRDYQGHPPPWPPPYETNKGIQAKLEAQSISSSSPSRSPGTVCSKMDA